MPLEQMRPILFIALAFVALLMWQAWQRDYGPDGRAAPQAVDGVDATEQGVGGAPTGGADVPTATAPPAPAGNQAPAPTDGPVTEASTPGSRLRITTDVLGVEVDLNGGTIARLSLLRYPLEKEKPDEPFILLNDSRANVFLAQSGLIGERGAPTHHATYRAERMEYRLDPGQDELEVPLRWEGEGVSVSKILRFKRNEYLIQIEHLVENRGDTVWRGQMYGQFRRANPNESRGLGTIYTYTGAVLSSPEKPYEKVDFDDLESQDIARDISGGWLAMIQHYFASAWVPPAESEVHYYSKSKGLPTDHYVVGLVAPAVDVAPGASERLALNLYAGPKVQKRLEAAAPGLRRAVDYGWLFFIAEPLYVVLAFIHGLIGNWGWSIIAVTILIKLIFFPLSSASYKSMARMRKLQPKVAQLKERHGSDRQKLNQAMMEMYKKEKINPLGGCLPIVVQIPVFIALYWVLLETVELRQAPFMFWLDDLSTHDPFYILPVAMGISMFVQQRLSPAPPDPIQAKVMMAMPIIFTFFFLFFPSGLVLYWLVNNLLSIAQQWVITKRIESGAAT